MKDEQIWTKGRSFPSVATIPLPMGAADGSPDIVI